MGASVVSSVSKPDGHNSRGKSRGFGLFWLAERHAIIRLTEGAKCAEIVLSKWHIKILRS